MMDRSRTPRRKPKAPRSSRCSASMDEATDGSACLAPVYFCSMLPLIRLVLLLVHPVQLQQLFFLTLPQRNNVTAIGAVDQLGRTEPRVRPVHRLQQILLVVGVNRDAL